MEGQSQATPVQGGNEPIVKVGGDSVTSFDELDAVMSQPNGGSKSAKTKDKTEEKVESKQKEEPNGKEESKESEKSSKEKLLDSKAKKEGESDGKKDSPPVKTFKLKNGDSEVEIRSDALIDLKVDGKVQKVQLQDALNNYSGVRHLQDQYTKFKSERTAFDNERKTLEDAFTHINTLASKKDTMGLLEYVGEILGKDALELRKSLVEQVNENLIKYSEMSPEERRAKELEEEVSFLRSRQERQKAKLTEEQELQKMQVWVDKVKTEHEIDDDTFHKLYTELVTFAKQEGHDPDAIDPDTVARYYKNLQKQESNERLENDVTEVLSQVGSNPDSLEEDKAELKSIWEQNKTLSKDDIREIALQVFGKSSAKRLAKKIGKLESRAETKIKDPANEPMFFDQLA